MLKGAGFLGHSLPSSPAASHLATEVAPSLHSGPACRDRGCGWRAASRADDPLWTLLAGEQRFQTRQQQQPWGVEAKALCSLGWASLGVCVSAMQLDFVQSM